MKRAASVLAAASALALLAGCAGYGGYGPGGGVAVGFVAPVGYDGWYDGYYGPIYNGYWGDNGVFYYRSTDHAAWHADSGGHFRHDAANGYHAWRGHQVARGNWAHKDRGQPH
ncbi:MAG: hypothetical protein ACRED9_07580 [Caulobacteraceae bacterium]